MTNQIAKQGGQKLPNGLTPPLRTLLDSQALSEHRAMVAFEQEVLAKKLDRFGWDRDRGTPAHDRMMTDWMDALQDYPLDEVKAACVAAVLDAPGKMPNEGHIRAQIISKRAKVVAAIPKQIAPQADRQPVAREVAERIMREAGIKIQKFGGTQ